MNSLLELRKQIEIDFLKTKTYEEINDMFNELDYKRRLAEKESSKNKITVQQVKDVFEKLSNGQISFSKATQILNGD